MIRLKYSLYTQAIEWVAAKIHTLHQIFIFKKNVDGYWLTELGGGAKIRFLGTELEDFEL